MLKSLIYEPLKLKGNPKDFLIWGCPHFNHDPKWENPIWKQRGFNSPQDAKEQLINNWNSKASNNTYGFILGDVMFGNGGHEEFLSLLFSLKFKRLYVCAGNHYAGFHQALKRADENGRIYHYDDTRAENDKETYIQFCPNYFEAFLNSQAFAFSHYPVLSWNGQAKGSILCYSHVHGSLGNTELGREYQKLCRAFEVSIEKSIYPFDLNQILDAMKDKPLFAPDHHTVHTQNPF